MENKLSVKDLRISFRTANGMVHAVRDINFDLAKGETLAIVGESGSGKSVTSRAILGIQAGNAVTEAGQIIYDGQDLLKINEEAFHKIRGDKIAMIFQDPMSSLNPIVKIGKQLTEAMLLKGKARQRESRRLFNTYLKALNHAMIAAIASGDSSKAQELSRLCKNFDKFEFKHIELESAYKTAKQAADDALSTIRDLAFEMEKNALKSGVNRVRDVSTEAKQSVNPYVVSDKGEEITRLAGQLPSQLTAAKKKGDYQEILKSLYRIQEILQEAAAKPVPDFFSMGYYMTYANKPLPEMPVPELNTFLRDYMNREFMDGFVANASKALAYTAHKAAEKMSEAVKVLQSNTHVFTQEKLDPKACKEAYRVMVKAVNETIDPLAIVKDSLVYTFAPSLKADLETYFRGGKKNIQAEKQHRKDQAKHDKLVAKGKNPDWEVSAAAVTDLEQVKKNIVGLIERLCDHYQELLSAEQNRDFTKDTWEVINYLKTNASGVVDKVTRRVAKARAIKLMEEVGIPEPHTRYNQYPFEFSGGMRQRIVIAIALAANPDILICDEPTTALDVTIQAQILELINKLKKERELSVIFITHDLGVVANMADRVAVMYAGKIVEIGTADDIFYNPRHPYTWALLSSMPDLDTNDRLEAIPGTPPNMIYPPVGDAFAARNKYAMQIDFEKQPPMFQVSDTHYAATWLLHPDAPKVEPPKAIRDRVARMKTKGGVAHGE